jgi:hypothetical protein
LSDSGDLLLQVRRLVRDLLDPRADQRLRVLYAVEVALQLAGHCVLNLKADVYFVPEVFQVAVDDDQCLLVLALQAVVVFQGLVFQPNEGLGLPSQLILQGLYLELDVLNVLLEPVLHY